MKTANNLENAKTDLVLESILSYINKNRLVPGDKLPSESELAQNLSVSRVSVREGLSGLKFLGLLRSTPSRGTEICNMDFDVLARCIGFQIAIDDVSFSDLLDARIAIETSVLQLVCGNLTEEQISELQELVDCTRRSLSQDEVARTAQTDQSFHRALLQASGNQILISFASLLAVFFNKAYPRLEMNENIIASQEHALILDALKKNNLDLARGIMIQHLERYRK